MVAPEEAERSEAAMAAGKEKIDHDQSWLYVVARRKATATTTILSVDGGGLRGMLPASVLVTVEQRIKQVIKERRKYLELEIKTVRAIGDKLKYEACSDDDLR